MRLRVRTVVGLVLALAFVVLAVWAPFPASLPSADQLVLLRRTQMLNALVARADRAPLLSSADVVASVNEHLVQDVISSVLPIDADIGKGYRLRIESAIARFEDGLALVRFDGRAVVRGSDTFADVSLFAGVDRVQLEPASGQLRARLTVFAVDAPRVRVGGREPDVARLVEALGPAGVEALTAWLPTVPIPILVQGDVDLPALASAQIRIPAAKLPLAFAIREVQVFRGRIWVALSAAEGQTPSVVDAQLRAADVPAVSAERRSLFALASRGCARERRRAEAVAQAQADLARQHDEAEVRFAQQLARDGVLREALSDESEVAVALRAEFVEQLVRRAASTYLRDVHVDLSGQVVRKDGEERRKTPFGMKRVGEWHAEVRLSGVHGTAHVLPPAVTLSRGNTVGLRVPVRVPVTRASAEVRVRWHSEGLARLVCRDFDLERRIDGVVPAFGQELSGGFVFAAEGDSLVAQPFFANRTLHIPAELTEASWEALREALATQDKLFRCGLGLNPDKVIDRLRDVVGRGFHADLPLKLFKPVRLPARFSQSVDLADKPVRLVVKASGAVVTERGLWARARMHAVHDGAGASAAAAAAGSD